MENTSQLLRPRVSDNPPAREPKSPLESRETYRRKNGQFGTKEEAEACRRGMEYGFAFGVSRIAQALKMPVRVLVGLITGNTSSRKHKFIDVEPQDQDKLD